jgi:hypothetical protein
VCILLLGSSIYNFLYPLSLSLSLTLLLCVTFQEFFFGEGVEVIDKFEKLQLVTRFHPLDWVASPFFFCSSAGFLFYCGTWDTDIVAMRVCVCVCVE